MKHRTRINFSAEQRTVELTVGSGQSHMPGDHSRVTIALTGNSFHVIRQLH